MLGMRFTAASISPALAPRGSAIRLASRWISANRAMLASLEMVMMSISRPSNVRATVSTFTRFDAAAMRSM